MNNLTTNGDYKQEGIMHISDSNVNEEVLKIANGFKPQFGQDTGNRKLKKKKTKGKGGKKRVLKRVWNEGDAEMSGWSSLVSEYINLSNPSSLQELSNIEEVDEDNYIPLEENKTKKRRKKKKKKKPVQENDESNREYSEESGEGESDSSPPGDELYDSITHLMVKRNSPRESIKVFNQ